MAMSKEKREEASLRSWVRYHEKFLKMVKKVEERGFNATAILMDCADGKLKKDINHYRRSKEGRL